MVAAIAQRRAVELGSRALEAMTVERRRCLCVDLAGVASPATETIELSSLSVWEREGKNGEEEEEWGGWVLGHRRTLRSSAVVLRCGSRRRRRGHDIPRVFLEFVGEAEDEKKFGRTLPLDFNIERS